MNLRWHRLLQNVVMALPAFICARTGPPGRTRSLEQPRQGTRTFSLFGSRAMVRWWHDLRDYARGFRRLLILSHGPMVCRQSLGL